MQAYGYCAKLHFAGLGIGHQAQTTCCMPATRRLTAHKPRAAPLRQWPRHPLSPTSVTHNSSPAPRPTPSKSSHLSSPSIRSHSTSTASCPPSMDWSARSASIERRSRSRLQEHSTAQHSTRSAALSQHLIKANLHSAAQGQQPSHNKS
jgi:hypothetical protein